MKIALVTGTGMDSKTITHILLSKGYNVVMTYRRNTTQDIQEVANLYAQDLINNPQSRLDFEFMDITDITSIRGCIEEILKKYGKIDECYNLCGMTHVGDSFKNIVYTQAATGTGVLLLLETLRDLSKTTKIYQASTSEMFGGDEKNCPFDENSPFEYRSPYSIAKGTAYNWVKYYRQTHGMYVCSGLLFNHSNEYRHPSFFFRKVTNSAAKIFLGKQKELFLGNIDHWRDEHLSDFGCEAMINMLNNKLGPKDYVICNGVCHHGEEYLDEIFNYFNLNWKMYVKTDKTLFRPNEVQKLLGNPALAKKEINWIPNRITFKEHVKLMCDYDYKLEKGENPVKANPFNLT